MPTLAALILLRFVTIEARADFGFVNTLASFNGINGDTPRAGLVQAADGNFYGTVSGGGANGFGTVFKVTKGGVLTRLYSFTGGSDGSGPQANLVQAANGKLYGTTPNGGSNGFGTVFSITTAGVLSKLYSFANGNDGGVPEAGLVLAADGNFYGTTSGGGTNGFGAIFRITASGLLTPFYSFTGGADGSAPRAGLMQASDGNFYGTTTQDGANGFGTIFKMLASGTLTTLHALDAAIEGTDPLAPLVEGRDGALYGTTSSGRTTSDGAVFKIAKNGSSFSVLKSFQGGADGIFPKGGVVQGFDGLLYGAASGGGLDFNGLAFRLNEDGSAFTVFKNFTGVGAGGVAPNAALVQGNDGIFYGTTSAGGTSNLGTIFRLTPGFAELQSLTGPSGNGANPLGALIQGSDEALYGTTFQGGANNAGTVFKLQEEGSDYMLLRSFSGSPGDGSNPATALLAIDGALYGTTYMGGTNALGTLFRLNEDGTGYRILRSFKGSDGANPIAGLIRASNGVLYGTTYNGGTGGKGVVLRLNPDGSGYTVLKSFTGSGGEGGNPQASLLQADDGVLYGTTSTGGGGGVGLVFKLNLDGTGFSNLFSFSTANGANPLSELMQGRDGALYGTTFNGGANNAGVLFRLNTSGSGYTVLKQFTGSAGDGANPEAALLQVNGGALFGTTYAGGLNGVGTVFKLNASGTGFTNLYTFTGSDGDGAQPRGALLLSSHSVLYGPTTHGGFSNSGSIFAISIGTTPANDSFTNRILLPGANPVAEGNNLNATLEPNESNHGGSFAADGANSVWWSWTAPANGPVSILAEGSSFDPLINVYTGSALSSLISVASNLQSVLNTEVFPSNIALAGLLKRVGFDAVAGTVYQIAVSGLEGGLIDLTVDPIALKVLSLNRTTNGTDSTIAFTGTVKVGNAGVTPPGPLRLRVIAVPGYSAISSYGAVSLPAPQVLSTNVVPTPGLLVPGTSRNVSISGVCPAPVVVDFDRFGYGWGVFVVLEAQVGTNWFLNDRDLLFYGLWPSLRGFGGVGGGVIRLNPDIATTPPRLNSVTINGPAIVNEGGVAGYSGTAKFNNGTYQIFSNTVWNASPISTIDTNGLFQAGSLSSNTPVILTCYYDYLAGEYSNKTSITVINLPTPSITGERRLSDKRFIFTLNSFPNLQFVVEGKTNVTTATPWVPLGTNVTDSNGRWVFEDLGATNLPRRFYRAHQLP